jgi:hypothetical protein
MYYAKYDTGRESQTHREMGTESHGSPAETAGLPPRVGDPVFLLLTHKEGGAEAFSGVLM